MTHLSWYRKYRPQTFDDVVGQPHIQQTLRNAVADGAVAHAYLFTGPRGTGKTTTARILAKGPQLRAGPYRRSRRHLRAVPGDRRRDAP